MSRFRVRRRYQVPGQKTRYLDFGAIGTDIDKVQPRRDISAAELPGSKIKSGLHHWASSQTGRMAPSAVKPCFTSNQPDNPAARLQPTRSAHRILLHSRPRRCPMRRMPQPDTRRIWCLVATPDPSQTCRYPIDLCLINCQGLSSLRPHCDLKRNGQLFSAASTSSSIFLASPKSMRLLSL